VKPAPGDALPVACSGTSSLGFIEALSAAQQVSDREQFRPKLFECEGLAVSGGDPGFSPVLLEVSFGPGNCKSLLV